LQLASAKAQLTVVGCLQDELDGRVPEGALKFEENLGAAGMAGKGCISEFD
jgi:hypothetical protein